MFIYHTETSAKQPYMELGASDENEKIFRK